MMTCDDVRAHLDAFLDGVLDRSQHTALEAHFARCDACREHLRGASAVEERLKRHYGREPVPPTLWARIQVSASEDWGGSRRRERAWTALSLAAGVLLAIGVAAVLTGPIRSPSEELTTVLVNELRTFVISRRDVDVASTDPLALRGWFVDKVEFSPPSPPDAGGRLELVGGRLCNILDRRVISFMYRAEGRPVSLYVMRDRGVEREAAQPGVVITEVNGFTHAGWSRSGLRYSLVTELPAERVEPITHQLMRETDGHEIST